MNALITALVSEGFEPERILPDALMSRYTTFRVGGKADVLVNIASAAEVGVALRAAKLAEAPVTVIGNGSNLLVRDGGIRGLVIRIANDFSAVSREGDLVHAQTGVSLGALSRYALDNGLSGMAELAGIPGTLGGGAIMNAGAYGAELANLIVRAEGITLSGAKRVAFEGEALGFGYRHSAMMDAGVILTDIDLKLESGDPERIRARMEETAALRREKQPLNLPSAGSTFKRPAGYFAAKLIDDCGLRGLRQGDAQVSEKHTGFVVNLGGATAADILTLMEEVQRSVLAQTGVALEPEVRILGEDAPRP